MNVPDPQVLAMLCSGEIRSIDLRMLRRGVSTETFKSYGGSDGTGGGDDDDTRLRVPQEWPVVTDSPHDDADLLECVLPRRLSGGAETLLATVSGGALLGEFGKLAESTRAA